MSGVRRAVQSVVYIRTSSGVIIVRSPAGAGAGRVFVDQSLRTSWPAPTSTHDTGPLQTSDHGPGSFWQGNPGGARSSTMAALTSIDASLYEASAVDGAAALAAFF